jgi:hypothetical protein
MVFGCGQSLHSAALYLLQSFANTHASTSSASKHKALQHLPQLHIVTATCRPASHLFFGSPPLRYGYIILMTSMQQRIGLAAPRRSASLHFLVGAAAASFALRSGWHGGVVADGQPSFSSFVVPPHCVHPGFPANGCSA